MIANEFVIEIEDKPGELAKLCEILGSKGINLKAITVDRIGTQTFVRLLVDKNKRAKEILEENNAIFTENDVIVKSLEDKPNALTEVARKLGKANVNIESLYLLNRNGQKVNIVFAVDNPQKGAEVLKE